MFGLRPQSESRPQVSCPGVDNPDAIDLIVVEEHADLPGRFELRISDPQCELWATLGDIVGSTVKIELDSGDEYQGQVWGRRLVRDPQYGGTMVSVWGSDSLASLRSPVRFRAFANQSATDVVESVLADAGATAQVNVSPSGRLAGATDQIVQYNESDLAFLRRLATMLGCHIWAWRGEVHFGGPPGESESISINLSADEFLVTELMLNEDWTETISGHVFPTKGTPFEGSAPLEGDDSLSPVSAGSGLGFDKLPKSGKLWPAGLALTAGEQKSLAESVAHADLLRQKYGFITLGGAPPSGAILGAQLSIESNGNNLADGLLIVGLRHQCQGQQRSTTIQFGRSGDMQVFERELRPATHLWPAKVVGEFVPMRSRLKVMPLGWEEQSDPMLARLVSGASTAKVSMTHVPADDELVLIGFESGNPDSPIVFGSLHDAEASENAPGDSAKWICKTPAGEMIATIEDEAIQLGLEKFALSVKAKSMTFEAADGQVSVNATEAVDISGDTVNLKKGG